MARLPRFPDLLTTANLCCGVASILLASQGLLTIACWLVFLAAVFDVFDGLAARALGGGSELGKQLDSLADLVSFGVAPGMLVWFVFKEGMPGDMIWYHGGGGSRWWSIPAAAMVIPIASAWRLAKFNVDTRQSSGFLGLPTPANALFWASIPLILISGMVHGQDFLAGFKGPGWLSIGKAIYTVIHRFSSIIFWVALILGILMLTELPLPSLKFKHGGWKGNETVFLLMGIGLVLVLLFGILAVPLLLPVYLLSPLWGKLFQKTT